MEYNDAKLRIEAIKANLKKWSREYYENDQPTVDDSVYDANLKELFELEQQYPELQTEDSPTKTVGGKTSSKFEKVKHEVAMLSLKNAFNNEDLLHFDRQINELFNDYNYFVEPKIDGLSISIFYNNGKIEKAITRGDGVIGEDVTNNVLQINSLPKEINFNDRIEVRGEIFISKETFELLNRQREEADEQLFANARNAASGTLRQLDSNVVKERNLDIYLYWAFNHTNKEFMFDKQSETVSGLSKLGFPTAEISTKANNINEVIEVINRWETIKEELNYDIDGIVIKVDESTLYDEIGNTSKFPKWAIAYKFPAETKETILIDIFPTVGRTGRITYNAALEPVQISGSMVQRATLHNADYITDLDLRIGDSVNIKKAGEIIPKVISANVDKRKEDSVKWVEAKVCPSCGTTLERIEGEVDQYCRNTNCPGRVIESIVHFTSRDAMNIEGLSVKHLEKFIGLGLIKDISDIYILKNHKDIILQQEGYKDKSVNNILNAIEQTKNNSLDKLLFGLGIRHIGKKTAKDLANTFKSLDNIINSSLEDLINQEDLGEVKSNSVIEYFNNEDNMNLLKRLFENGVSPKQEIIEVDVNSPLYNKKVVVTGKIEGATREEIKSLLERMGAKPMSSISKETDLVFAGANASQTKLSKVDKDNIKNVINISEIENYGK